MKLVVICQKFAEIVDFFWNHHLSDNYVYFSDFYVDLPVIYVDMSLCRLVRKKPNNHKNIYGDIFLPSLVRLLC